MKSGTPETARHYPKRLFTAEELQASIKQKSRVDDNGCWRWKYSTNSRGYGQMWNGITNVQAHRTSYEVFIGNAGGKFVCHKCDVPCCVNPDHLFLGSGADNLNDCYSKRRRGTVLTKNQLSEMKKMVAAKVPYKRVGEILGIGHSTVCRIKQKGFKPAYEND